MPVWYKLRQVYEGDYGAKGSTLHPRRQTYLKMWNLSLQVQRFCTKLARQVIAACLIPGLCGHQECLLAHSYLLLANTICILLWVLSITNLSPFPQACAWYPGSSLKVLALVPTSSPFSGQCLSKGPVFPNYVNQYPAEVRLNPQPTHKLEYLGLPLGMTLSRIFLSHNKLLSLPVPGSAIIRF